MTDFKEKNKGSNKDQIKEKTNSYQILMIWLDKNNFWILIWVFSRPFCFKIIIFVLDFSNRKLQVQIKVFS